MLILISTVTTMPSKFDFISYWPNDVYVIGLGVYFLLGKLFSVVIRYSNNQRLRYVGSYVDKCLYNGNLQLSRDQNERITDIAIEHCGNNKHIRSITYATSLNKTYGPYGTSTTRSCTVSHTRYLHAIRCTKNDEDPNSCDVHNLEFIWIDY